jgi:hypothetical protein
MTHDRHDVADLDKHTDEELERAIKQADEERPRVEAEDSDAALEANRRQREAMREELEERG